MDLPGENSLIVIQKKNAVDSSGLLKSKLQHLKVTFSYNQMRLIDCYITVYELSCALIKWLHSLI